MKASRLIERLKNFAEISEDFNVGLNNSKEFLMLINIKIKDRS